ncbi:MAG: Electron transport complex subunit RsxB [candidate division WS2 bacterium]|uniref:Electron transport complex subunit RsxB n=1 Tax=Psychracetigena formicireducens TaxID=2986056 RepID=A0A9E2BFN0_PSYF1|nr:Electron transport complex subunit RsxB [Candidatus Psychracetigena formicireducens]
MSVRSIIKIDEEKCNGCGLCIPNCPEGALQVIDGKARLISDLFCDGLGACLGFCPEGAIEIVEREAEPYDEYQVMENIVKQGDNVIKAHLLHLKEHGEKELFNQALDYLRKNDYKIPQDIESESLCLHTHEQSGCPGSKVMDFRAQVEEIEPTVKIKSQLRQWPVQLHLVSPRAPYFEGADIVLAADCVAYALGNFHTDYLKGKSLAIACPKLDEGQDVYLEKLKDLIDVAKINTLTVMIMQVPCCMGLSQLAKLAISQLKRKIPLKLIVVGIQGEILKEEWVSV